MDMTQILKISMRGADRHFEANLHLMIVEKGESSCENIILASYLGIPEAVTAVSAGIIEGREAYIGSTKYNRSFDPFKRVEKPIGLGDIAHGVVYNSYVTMEGIEGIPDSAKFNRSYIIASDGKITEALATHVINRFGLPYEWEREYPQLLDHMTTPLKVIRNSEYTSYWPDLKAIVFDGNEQTVLDVVECALKNGMLQIPESDVQGEFDPSFAMKEYMLANAEHMARKLQEKRPRHSLHDPIHRSIGEMKRIPFPAQAHMIQALINTLEYENSAFCSGDMGTGKSIISCGVAEILHQRKVANGSRSGTAILLSAPGITLSKWKQKEIHGTLKNAKVDIIQDSSDALKFLKKVRNGYRPKGLEFTLIGIDRAKLSPEPYFSGIWKRIAGSRDYAWHCPDCGRAIMVKDEESECGYAPAQWFHCAEGLPPSYDELAKARSERSLLPNGLPRRLKIKWRKTKRIEKCTYNEAAHLPEEAMVCFSKLWRPAVRNRGETRNKPRVNISQIFKRAKKYFDLYLCDEVHQCKAESSGRGDAFAQMVKSAKKTLMLTGTLTNGKSSSIKELLWRTDPKALIDQGFDHTTGSIQWAARYGKLQQIVEVDDEDTGWVTRKKQRPKQPTEEPGIAPQLTAEFLLHKAGFLELSDMGLPLVELKELPIFIDMDREQGNNYRAFHNDLHDECVKRSLSGYKGAWSKFIPATINYADRPDLGGFVVFGKDDNDPVTISAPKADRRDYHRKEQELIQLVKNELAEGRRCVVFNNYTGSYQMNERIRDILKENGVACEILDEPNTDNRAELLADLEERGVPVVITNMKLVEVGLDLMYWPTIIYYQLNYEVSTIRQSSRRAWRLGQDRECRVYYLVYNGTQQMAQFIKIMSARGHALMVEGRLDRSELAKYSRDKQSSLASDLANCFAGSEVAKAWTELAAKDLANVEMIEESQFKEVLSARMEALANETRRLCGLPPIDAGVHDEPEFLEEDELNLFNFIPVPSEGAVVQLDLFELGHIKVVDMSQYKKKRSRNTPCEDQLAFNF